MKKITLFLILFLCSSFVFADSISATADLGFIQDFIVKTYSYQFSGDVRYSFSNRFEIRTPITVSATKDATLFDTGIFLNYYPWEKIKLYFGLSLVQFGFIHGETDLDKNIYSLNEVNIGWSFRFAKGLTIEPSLSIRDPSGTFSDEFEMIKGSFPCNRSFRFRLAAGWTFNINR